MESEVGLVYGFDHAVGKYFFRIWRQIVPTRGRLPVQSLDGVTFEEMLCEFSKVLNASGVILRAVMQREEVIGSSKELSQKFIEELKRDPAAVSKALTMPETTIVVTQKKTQLRIGVESLADTFGDRVYLRRVESECECPGCGGWAGVSEAGTVRCGECLTTLHGTWHEDGWVSVQTQGLLNNHRPQYFLPRYWNPSRAWIGIDDLRAMYALFLKERQECKDLVDNKV